MRQAMPHSPTASLPAIAGAGVTVVEVGPIAVMLAVAAAGVLRLLPPFGHPLMSVSWFYPASAVRQTGAVNVVTSIILDYRGYDTLGEATILFTAVVGVVTVMRSRGRKSEHEHVPESEE